MGATRSKGCNTCRRRKVKCDERRPACEKCQNIGYECEGYVRERRFVDEVSRTIRDAEKGQATDSVIAPSHSNTRFLGVPTKPSVPSSLDMSAFEDNIHVSFLLSVLFLSIVMPTSLMHIHAKDTTSLVAQLSMRALSTAYFGRKHRQEAVIKRGVLNYRKALKRLNQDLQYSEKAFSLAILSSAVTLEVYEFIASDSNYGWISHAGGVGRLIELRGPERHQTKPEKDIFEANRINIILESWIRGKRCFLEQIKWKTVPWALEPSSKNAMSHLQDIWCDLPGLMDDARNIRNPEVEGVQKASSSHEALERNILIHLRGLYAWRSRWKEEYPNSYHEIPVQQYLDEQPLFPTMFYFSSLERADEFIFYNTALMILLKLGAKAISPTFDASTSAFHLPPANARGPLCPPNELNNIQSIAAEICKCVGYYLSDYRNRPGLSLLISLRIAYIAFLPASRHAQWIHTTVIRVADLNGLRLRDLVPLF